MIVIAVGLVEVATPGAASRFVVTRRPPDVHLGSQWELPGGKVLAHESPAAALVRELAEELGVEVTPPEPLTFSWHAYPERTVLLLFFRTRVTCGEPRPLAASELRLVTLPELLELPFPPANQPFIDLVNGLVIGASSRAPSPQETP